MINCNPSFPEPDYKAMCQRLQADLYSANARIQYANIEIQSLQAEVKRLEQALSLAGDTINKLNSGLPSLPRSGKKE